MDMIGELIRAIARNDESALNQLYRQIGGRLFNIAKGILKDHHLAEDAVQETMIKLIKYAGKFSTGNGLGYIIRILNNVCIDELKRRKMEICYEDFYLQSEEDDSNFDQKLAVNMALDKLDPFDKKIIVMKYFLEMSVRDIAKEVNKSKSSVALQIKEAEEKLKKLLE